MFHVLVIYKNAVMVVYGILFGGMHPSSKGARCSSVVRTFAHGAMGLGIHPSWWTH